MLTHLCTVPVCDVGTSGLPRIRRRGSSRDSSSDTRPVRVTFGVRTRVPSLGYFGWDHRRLEHALFE